VRGTRYLVVGSAWHKIFGGGKCVAQDNWWWEVRGTRYLMVGSAWHKIFGGGKCVAQDIWWWEVLEQDI